MFVCVCVETLLRAAVGTASTVCGDVLCAAVGRASRLVGLVAVLYVRERVQNDTALTNLFALN